MRVVYTFCFYHTEVKGGERTTVCATYAPIMRHTAVPAVIHIDSLMAIAHPPSRRFEKPPTLSLPAQQAGVSSPITFGQDTFTLGARQRRERLLTTPDPSLNIDDFTHSFPPVRKYWCSPPLSQQSSKYVPATDSDDTHQLSLPLEISLQFARQATRSGPATYAGVRQSGPGAGRGDPRRPRMTNGSVGEGGEKALPN